MAIMVLLAVLPLTGRLSLPLPGRLSLPLIVRDNHDSNGAGPLAVPVQPASEQTLTCARYRHGTASAASGIGTCSTATAAETGPG
jgi:hypothetical protein